MKKIYKLFVLLLLGSSGARAQGVYQLWATTANGGKNNTGVLFNLDSSGNNFTLRHEFNQYNPGGNPEFSELVELNGLFYGTTTAGGINNMGVIFEWDPDSDIYRNKIDFSAANGSVPLGKLALYEGKFYGMTQVGGANSAGVIYEWDPVTNIYLKKVDLTISGGSNPQGALTYSNGKFYGMTYAGGANNKGVIFEWDPVSNIYTKRIDLNTTDGSQPTGYLTDAGGKFYGITNKGGSGNIGVIFEWDPTSNTYTKRVDFDGYNANNSFGSLIEYNGKYYGMSRNGGDPLSHSGNIFEWDPVTNICVTKIDCFRYPCSNLVQQGGKFYGVTRGDAPGQTYVPSGGNIFEWDPVANTISYKYSFDDPSAGNASTGTLAYYQGKFYGTTSMGGSGGSGVIFEWDPVANTYNKKIDFNGNNGFNPSGALSVKEGKFYAVTNRGGWNDKGVIYEWDPNHDSIRTRIQLSAPMGAYPYGKLIESDGKYYGMTSRFGLGYYSSSTGGTMYEWDPTTNIFTKLLYLIDDANCANPYGSLALFNGKFYGMTNAGGANNAGVIFEWDPATNIFITKVALSAASGANPYSSMLLQGGKFYGMTYAGGANNAGVIFEWDPETNIYSKKIDLSVSGGSKPYGSLTWSSGKFYGMTYAGGTNNKGVIFEWDPVTNIYEKKIDFTGTNGSNPQGSLVMSNGKFYGMTYAGGTNNKGVIFEWDPLTNAYSKKFDFSGNNGSNPGIGNDFSLVQAPVANGLAGVCTATGSVIIDNSNNNRWVSITDNRGDAIAEINANGNNLGLVNTSIFINNDSVREDGAHNLYLDRNLTITPTNQPTTPVDIRLYIKKSEYLTLKNAINSVGQTSGISSINDLGIYKNSNTCSPAIGSGAAFTPTQAEDWENGYVLLATVSSFSTFYFASKNLGGPLPVTRMELRGKLVNNDGEISWRTTDEFNTASFDLQRSTDGRAFTTVANIAAANQAGIHHYNYIDKNIISLRVPTLYYRLKQKDLDGHFLYSDIVTLSLKENDILLLYPNPVKENIGLIINLPKSQMVDIRILDNTGRVIKRTQKRLPAGSNFLPFDVSGMAKGIYSIELKSEAISERRQFVKL